MEDEVFETVEPEGNAPHGSNTEEEMDSVVNEEVEDGDDS